MPELAKVLRDAIEDVRPAGRRLIFEYYIFLGVYHLNMYPDYAYYIKVWADYLTQGYDTDIYHWGDRWIETELGKSIANQLSHSVFRGKMISSLQLLQYYKDPWTNGWILAEKGLENYRGMITDNNIDKIIAEDVLYK